ncbi:MAG: DUF2889 domain-containing protein [Burkholderiaceae bacterium]|nr:DUF2889 domain-containing protein [Burkholderiaceae bacterium]
MNAETMSSDNITRQEMHQRKLDLRFYKRSDGLYEVVGEMMDTKSHPFTLQLRTEPLLLARRFTSMVMTWWSMNTW